VLSLSELTHTVRDRSQDAFATSGRPPVLDIERGVGLTVVDGEMGGSAFKRLHAVRSVSPTYRNRPEAASQGTSTFLTDLAVRHPVALAAPNTSPQPSTVLLSDGATAMRSGRPDQSRSVERGPLKPHNFVENPL